MLANAITSSPFRSLTPSLFRFFTPSLFDLFARQNRLVPGPCRLVPVPCFTPPFPSDSNHTRYIRSVQPQHSKALPRFYFFALQRDASHKTDRCAGFIDGHSHRRYTPAQIEYGLRRLLL
jgi:hypothetical protein